MFRFVHNLYTINISNLGANFSFFRIFLIFYPFFLFSVEICFIFLQFSILRPLEFPNLSSIPVLCIRKQLPIDDFSHQLNENHHHLLKAILKSGSIAAIRDFRQLYAPTY